MNIWDLRLKGRGQRGAAGGSGMEQRLGGAQSSLIINGQERAGEAQLVLLDPNGEEFMLEAEGEASLLLLSGEPIDEPIVGYGPFVMNSEAEIHQAIDDFNSGRFAVIAPETILIKTKRLMALCFMGPGQPSQPRASASLPHKAASRMPSRVRSSQITTSCPTLTGIRVARMQGMEARRRTPS